MLTGIFTTNLGVSQETDPARAERLSRSARRAIDRGSAALPPIGVDRRAVALMRFVAAGAWTDAALALVGLEAPEWQVRRLEIDDGEWSCCLSREPRMPLDFDEVAEGRDPVAARAILAALAAAAELPPRAAADRTLSPSHRWPAAASAWLDNCR